MHPSILEKVERVRKKIEAAQGEITAELRLEYAVLDAELTATIEAYHMFVHRLERMKEILSHDTNELIVFGNLLKGKTKNEQ